jgi:hypothetical protein
MHMVLWLLFSVRISGSFFKALIFLTFSLKNENFIHQTSVMEMDSPFLCLIT